MKISFLLNNIKENLTTDKILLKDILSFSGKSSYFIMFLMTLFSNIPTPVIPIISSFFGILMAISSFQILIGNQSLVIPSFMQKIKIKKKLMDATIEKLAPFFAKIENLTKVRMVFLFNRRKQRFLLNLVNFTMSLLIIIPVPLISFMPAIAVMLIVFGLINKDGLYILMGLLIAVISLMLYFSFFIFGKNILIRLRLIN